MLKSAVLSSVSVVAELLIAPFSALLAPVALNTLVPLAAITYPLWYADMSTFSEVAEV